ncbi:MAG: hydantoinase B/oxoprolinase family protein [Planctomycetota bacterium]
MARRSIPSRSARIKSLSPALSDPIRLEVFHQLLAALCEEAGAVLQRSAASPNIRERRDFSVALFDGAGRLVAQAAHIPVHLGSAADSVRAVQRELDLEPGDLAILNDPFRGGTHLPDVTLVLPVFVRGDREPDFFLVDRAHHADIGGATPGSMAAAADLCAEGLVIPPVKLRARGQRVSDVMRMILANVRGADERQVDLAAQESALLRGEERLRALVGEHGLDVVTANTGHLMDYAERIARGVVRAFPRGSFAAEDQLDGDGLGSGPLPIRLELSAQRGRLRFDWRGSADQARGGVNANRGIVVAASVYLLRCLCPERLPTNDGLFRALEVVTRPGSVLEPRAQAPVAGGNVETSQRLVDVGLKALARAMPGRIPACSSGTMVNLTLGGRGARSFTSYETLPGGAGAGPSGEGVSAVQTHMTNTRNTPIEDAEHRWPIVVRALHLRTGSGGVGRCRGGDGIVKEIELREPAVVSLFAERELSAPEGVEGGGPGAPLRVALRIGGGTPESLPAKFSRTLPEGARVRIETPGGGGFGAP